MIKGMMRDLLWGMAIAVALIGITSIASANCEKVPAAGTFVSNAKEKFEIASSELQISCSKAPALKCDEFGECHIEGAAQKVELHVKLHCLPVFCKYASIDLKRKSDGSYYGVQDLIFSKIEFWVSYDKANDGLRIRSRSSGNESWERKQTLLRAPT